MHVLPKVFTWRLKYEVEHPIICYVLPLDSHQSISRVSLALQKLQINTVIVECLESVHLSTQALNEPGDSKRYLQRHLGLLRHRATFVRYFYEHVGRPNDASFSLCCICIKCYVCI